MKLIKFHGAESQRWVHLENREQENAFWRPELRKWIVIRNNSVSKWTLGRLVPLWNCSFIERKQIVCCRRSTNSHTLLKSQVAVDCIWSVGKSNIAAFVSGPLALAAHTVFCALARCNSTHRRYPIIYLKVLGYLLLLGIFPRLLHCSFEA